MSSIQDRVIKRESKASWTCCIGETKTCCSEEQDGGHAGEILISYGFMVETSYIVGVYINKGENNINLFFKSGITTEGDSRAKTLKLSSQELNTLIMSL